MRLGDDKRRGAGDSRLDDTIVAGVESSETH
jgi:hypothetical protein